MDPRLRAIADRYVLDVANIKFMTEGLPPDALGRTVVDSGWTVADVIAHLAEVTERQAGAVEGFAAEGVLEPGRPVVEPPSPSSDDLDRLSRGRDRLMAALATIDAPPDDVVAVLSRWSFHYARHGIDLAEALDEARLNLLVVKWLLHADFRDEPTTFARQRALFRDFRDRLTDRHEGKEDANES